MPESLPMIGIIEARYSPPRLGTLGLVGCAWLEQLPANPWCMQVRVARVRCLQGAMVPADMADLPVLVLLAMQEAMEAPMQWRLSQDWQAA